MMARRSSVLEKTNADTQRGASPLSAKSRREDKKALKYARSTSKALRNQSQSRTRGNIQRNHLEKVEEALHGPNMTKSAVTPKQISEYFRRHIEVYDGLRDRLNSSEGGSESRCNGQNDSQAAQLSLPYIQEVFAKLDIQPAAPKENKQRKMLISEIVQAILADLEYLANEARETERREAGYWQFVNKRTYSAMERNNQEINWATGEKILEQKVEE